MLSVKLYHNRLVKHALEAKKKKGLKVDEAVMDFYRTQPEDEDFEESRRLERAQAAMTKRLKERKRNKQMSTLLAAATMLAAKSERETKHDNSSRSLIHALADIGVQLPLELQIGLPYGDDDVYLSDDDGHSSATASPPGSDNEADVDELLDELDTTSNVTADGTRRRNLKKRKRDDSEMMEGEEVTGASETIEGGVPASTAAGLPITSPTASELKKKALLKAAKRKLLPPLPIEDTFSLFYKIRDFLLSRSTTSAGAQFGEIVSHIKENDKLVHQVPYGMTLDRMILLALEVLLRNPISIGFALAPKKNNIFSYATSSSSSFDSDASNVVPFLKRLDSPSSTELDSAVATYSWNLPRGHSQNELLESLEALFFFALTREYLTTPNGRSLDFEQARVAKSSLTLPPSSEAAIAEFRAQEVMRYNAPELPFTFTCSHPIPGFSPKTISMPNLKSNPTGRKGALLKADRPERVTNVSLVRDALSRLPGGVGTRLDIASLVLQSQYIAPEISDISQIASTVSSTLDRMHLEYDAGVRYDSDLRLYIYIHRQRTEEDFIYNTQLAERAKRGDTSELWTAMHANMESIAQPAAATLKNLLQSKVAM